MQPDDGSIDADSGAGGSGQESSGVEEAQVQPAPTVEPGPDLLDEAPVAPEPSVDGPPSRSRPDRLRAGAATIWSRGSRGFASMRGSTIRGVASAWSYGSRRLVRLRGSVVRVAVRGGAAGASAWSHG